MSRHTEDEANAAESTATVQVRPLPDILVTITSTNRPTWSFERGSIGPFFVSLNDKKPETSGIPRSRMYPWSSMLLTAADNVCAER